VTEWHDPQITQLQDDLCISTKVPIGIMNTTDLATHFNNAGVIILQSDEAKYHYDVALDLFRGALETKLALEFAHRFPIATGAPHGGDLTLLQEQEILERQVFPSPEATDIIYRAVVHLDHLNLYLTPTPKPPDFHESSHPQTETVHSLQLLLAPSHAVVPPLASQGYQPYLCTFPFFVAEDSALSAVASSVIVYHLGLVHQLMERHSVKTADFYTISAALLASEVQARATILLRISLLNNFGVWCFENGDGESMRVCMEHLSTALQGEENEDGCLIESEVIASIRRNILWLLTPPNGASPAA
jgi:hypothetical protein